MINAIQRCIIRAQILFPNGIRQNIHIGFTGVHLVLDVHIFGAVHHVGGVAGPATQVGPGLDDFGGHALNRRIVGDVQSAKHVTQVNFVAIWQGKLFQIL